VPGQRNAGKLEETMEDGNENIMKMKRFQMISDISSVGRSR